MIDIYNMLCSAIAKTDELSLQVYSQNYFAAGDTQRKIINLITELVSRLENTEFAINVSSGLEAALGYMQDNDYIAFADFCSEVLKKECVSVICMLREEGLWQEVKNYYDANYSACDDSQRAVFDDIECEKEDVPEGYELIETGVGTFSLQVTTCAATKKSARSTNLLLASRLNPYHEAAVLARQYDDGKPEVLLLGFGMGYLVEELLKYEDICRITVCEHDRYVLKAAMHYRNLANIMNSGRVRVLYDPQLKNFSRELLSENDKTIIIHNPSMMNIRDTHLRESVQNFFLHDSSVRNQGRKLKGNFMMNTASNAIKNVRFADELKNVFRDKNVLLLAAGPSLEDRLELFREEDVVVTVYDENGVTDISYEQLTGDKGSEYVLVCVGTVLKRLVALGITPDYVVMTDPQENMLGQIQGVDTKKLKLIYLSTLYYGVPELWQGEKYMALQKDFYMAEKLAAEKNLTLFETGGSVSAFALDVLIRFLAKRVVCIGLDLAFTDNKRHAGEAEFDTQQLNLRAVKGTGGDTVYTSLNLDNYRAWIERRISRRTVEEQKVELINMSQGAYIDGMKNEPGIMSLC